MESALASSDAHLLIVGCGDVGVRTARDLKSVVPNLQITGLRRRPPHIDSATSNPPNDSHVLAAFVDDWLAADVSEPTTLARLPQDVTHVLFTLTPAARTEEGYRQTYLLGMQNVMAALDTSQLQRVVYVSSSAVYGEHHGEWIDELTAATPDGFNGVVLLEAEQWLHRQGLSSTALRLAGIYGPERTQLLDRIKSGQARAPVSPVHWANRIHVDDAAQACATLLMAARIQPTYLGVDDTPLPLHTLYAELAHLLGVPAPGEGPAPAKVGSKRLSNARLKTLGWQPAHPNSRDSYRKIIATNATYQT